MEIKKSKNNDNNNGKKDIEGINNDHRSQYTYDSSDAKEIMTGVGGGEKGRLFLILINILLKTSRNLLKRKRIDLVKRVMQKVVQSNQIIKMKIIELFIFTTTKLLIKVH